MFKKTPHKRKIRQIVKLIFGFLLLFAGSLLCLFSVYFIFFIKKYQVFNPLTSKFRLNSVINRKRNIFDPTAENEQKIKILLNKHAISFTSIYSHQDSLIVILKDGSEIIFSPKKDLQSQIASLQLIMKHFTIEGKLFKRIDFRFNNPVVTF